MARREYSAETKATVLAALIAGQTLRQVSDLYDVPKTTILGWKLRAGVPVFLQDGIIPTPKKTDLIPQLVVDLMIARLQSQIALAQHCADKEWLNTQEAGALAILLGVQDDKLYRMLEALERARSQHSIAGSE